MSPARITILLFSFFLSLPAQAGYLANVDVFDRKDGRVLPVYFKDGQQYVIGEPGHEYEIRVRSVSGERLLAVTSVDGVNVITGQTASPDQGGYVLDPYNSVDIAGWRKSMDRIATFFFTKLKNSYAARTGRPNDVGVIGVALFRERPRPRPQPCCWPYGSSRDEAESRSAAPAAPAAEAMEDSMASRRAPKQEQKLGTGHGRSEDSHVVYTEFERASSRPDETITIFYDSRKNLVAQGVIPDDRWYARRQPNPFPQGFVPDP
jgi:hypothetical protein